MLKPGMEFSTKPRLFLKEEAMVYDNHETIVLMEDSYGEWLSLYPRDLEYCTITI